ncbi:Wzt carbohydrate-binding domain-containing protein [Polaromonas sp. P1(28)-8]|nr:Wzt carbohydrate-binding domain-containing protein [Polaromonas sp. P1(28)-8]
MLFVSHDTSAIINLCGSAIWLKNSASGEFVTGVADQVCKAYLKDFYGQQELVSPHGLTQQISRSPLDSADAIEPQASVTYESDPLIETVFEISPFNPEAESFGVQGATIRNAWFVDEHEQRISSIKSGDLVKLFVEVFIHKKVVYPAFGITLKDRLGQFLFSEGTDGAFRSAELSFSANDVATAEFSFRMPVLIPGAYSIDLAFAEGLGHEHIQHHWMHDAISLRSIKGRLVQGVCGLQDLAIKIFQAHEMETQ